MHIPEFLLPSDINRSIKFNAPTVAEALSFSGRDPNTNEQATTEYLDALQVDAAGSSRNWTAQDRSTALWWIFTHTNVDTMMTYSYECDHCGNEHLLDFDMRDLGAEIRVIDGPAYIEGVQIPVQGKPHIWRLQPLTGHGMELLEGLRLALPDPAEPGYNRALVDLRYWEIVFQCELNDEIETDYANRANSRYALIKTMELDSEFKVLAASIRQMRDHLAHGLPITTSKGESRILITYHPCPENTDKEPAEAFLTPLLVPFRPREYITDFGSGWLADFSEQPGFVWGTEFD